MIAETDVVRFAVGQDMQNLKSEVWTFWGSAEKPDFYVTSSLINAELKGSIHPTRGQFSFTTQAWPPPSFENWVGSRPESRHLDTIAIRHLVAGEHFHVMTIRLPDIGLRKVGVTAKRPRRFEQIPPFGYDECVTLNLVLYEGDWKEFISQLPGQKAIAAIRNQSGRSLIVFKGMEQESDPVALYDQFLKGLQVSNTVVGLGGDLTLFVGHKREPNQPILLTELHNIAAQTF